VLVLSAAVLVLVLETSLGTAAGSLVPISIPCQMMARSFDYEHRFTEHEHRYAEHEHEHEQERRLPCHLGWATRLIVGVSRCVRHAAFGTLRSARCVRHAAFGDGPWHR
jgi:hypothetical protein